MTDPAATVSEQCPQPFYPTRLLNLAGRFRKPLVLEPAEMMETASKASKLDEWGDDEFGEALQVFCSAVNEDREMHHAGKVFTRMGIVKWLRDRLEIQEALERNPEILDKPVVKPILIPGEARAGTTLLHRLLALDRRFRAPRSWELFFPLPPPDPSTYEGDPRVERMQKLYRKAFRTCPAIEIAHPMEANLPEECWHLLDRSFIRFLLALYNEIPRYTEWLACRSDENLTGDYRYYKKQLQLLQWKFPHPRWVLKSPVHGTALRAFFNVFPDAHFIHCHRDPCETLPSACSLAAARYASYYSHVDLRKLGAKVLGIFQLRAARMMDARETIGADGFTDVSYRTLMRAPMDTVLFLYKKLGLDLDTETEQRMRSFLTAQRQGRHTRHHYSLDQFGLDATIVERAFEGYRAVFKDYY